MILVPAQKYHFGSPIGTISRGSSRPVVQKNRHRGLHPKSGLVQFFKTGHKAFLHPRLGHVCISGKQNISQFRYKVSSLEGNQGRCTKLSFGGHFPLLCQPTLENNSSMVTETEGQSSHGVLGHSALLGFCHMVAPFGKNAGPKDSSTVNRTFSGYVQKLLGGRDSPPQGGTSSLYCYQDSVGGKGSFN